MQVNIERYKIRNVCTRKNHNLSVLETLPIFKEYFTNVVAEWTKPWDSTVGDQGFESRVEVNAR